MNFYDFLNMYALCDQLYNMSLGAILSIYVIFLSVARFKSTWFDKGIKCKILKWWINEEQELKRSYK